MQILVAPTYAQIVSVHPITGVIVIDCGGDHYGPDSFTYRLYSPVCGYSNIATVDLDIVSAVGGPGAWPDSTFASNLLLNPLDGSPLSSCGTCLTEC